MNWCRAQAVARSWDVVWGVVLGGGLSVGLVVTTCANSEERGKTKGLREGGKAQERGATLASWGPQLEGALPEKCKQARKMCTESLRGLLGLLSRAHSGVLDKLPRQDLRSCGLSTSDGK